jgi:predicted RNA-binding Zn ribbon-like protein
MGIELWQQHWVAELMADIFGAMMRGYGAGNDLRTQRNAEQKQSTLAALAQKAYTAPRQERQGALSEMVGVDPQAGLAMGQQMSADDDRRAKALVRSARMLAAAPEEARPQIYASMIPELQSMGVDGLPPQYDATVAKSTQDIVQAWAGVEEDDNTPAAIRELQMLQQNPELAQLDMQRRQAGWQPKMFEDAGGMSVYDPRTGAARPLEYGGQQAPQMPSGGASSLLESVIQQESGGNPNAVSPKGARGLMQLMPGTQRDPGFGVQPARDDSPQENVRMGRDYLNAMLDRYQGNEELALAAYNAGPGRVDQALQMAGGDPQRALAQLPAETRNYVPSVLGRVSQGGGQRVMPAQKPQAPSALQERIALAQQMGAAPEDIRRMVTGGEPAPAPTQKASSANAIKLAQVQNVDRSIGRIESALKALDGGLVDTGPLDGRIQKFTSKGQELDAAVGAIQNSFLALTRVPGMGSQSDLEAKIAALQYPALDKAPEVNRKTLQQLREFAADLKRALEGQPGATPSKAAPAQNDDDALIGKYL